MSDIDDYLKGSLTEEDVRLLQSRTHSLARVLHWELSILHGQVLEYLEDVQTDHRDDARGGLAYALNLALIKVTAETKNQEVAAWLAELDWTAIRTAAGTDGAPTMFEAILQAATYFEQAALAVLSADRFDRPKYVEDLRLVTENRVNVGVLFDRMKRETATLVNKIREWKSAEVPIVNLKPELEAVLLALDEANKRMGAAELYGIGYGDTGRKQAPPAFREELRWLITFGLLDPPMGKGPASTGYGITPAGNAFVGRLKKSSV